jgi:DNA segregation ATPase FtsK/SpoIIIE, S-DNA-T family
VRYVRKDERTTDPSFFGRSFFRRALARPRETRALAMSLLERAERNWQEKARVIESEAAAARNNAEETFDHAVRGVERRISDAIESAPHLFGGWDEIGETLAAATTSVAEPVAPAFVRVGGTLWSPGPNAPPSITAVHVPALVRVRQNRGIIIKTDGKGKACAAAMAQSTALRLLLALSPGKLRFTLIDPVGLGRNASGLLHLADHDIKLINGRVWTQAQHIEQRLLDLTEDMERVVLRIRNKFANVEEYNTQAGALSEPYRVLVVFDFPVGFREDAARSLVSIVQNGPLYGVFPIIVWNADEAPQHGVVPEEFARTMTVIRLHEGGRIEVPGWPVEAPSPVADDFPIESVFTKLVDRVGEHAKAADAVIVPFAEISRALTEPASWWRDTSADGLRVPLGRMGVEKVRNLELGAGTAQHVLVAGKTGSGKSTLLHTAVLNLALQYSPDELQLYLIDFKKGVEFKPYADERLPHARVIAIESEREFGLSVLQGLAAELDRRGKAFRAAGVDHIAAYRSTTGDRLPRVVLLVDEFQMFFAEDDGMSADISRILDDFVRQGRAFGVHVILSSQTLRGIRYLSSSTVEQIGVRIALQCSAEDSRLILADDNPAARNITRPGEAVYNGMNGSIEGNDFFQVAFLTDDERRRHLQAIRRHHDSMSPADRREPLVFEGNAPAKIEMSDVLSRVVGHKGADGASEAPTALLGEPTTIKDLTSVRFPRQAGRNLALIGQNEQLASGLVASALASLCLTTPSGEARFVVCDLMPPDRPDAYAFGHLTQGNPHNIRIVQPKQLEGIVRDLAKDVATRMDAVTDPTNVYLFLYGLQRARELQRSDFASYDAEPTVHDLFTKVLQSGPEVGIHTILWADSFSSIDRRVGAQVLRDIDLRVAMQMNSDDSHRVVDAASAHRLGSGAAILYDIETGVAEKFRPFAPPPRHWLVELSRVLQNTSKRTAPS